MLIVEQQVRVVDLAPEVHINPAYPAIKAGQSLQFCASVYNTFYKGLTWTCLNGTIDPNSGLYTAPSAYLYSDGSDTITATLQFNPTIVNATNVTLEEYRELVISANIYPTTIVTKNNISSYNTQYNFGSLVLAPSGSITNVYAGSNIVTGTPAAYGGVTASNAYLISFMAYGPDGTTFVPYMEGSVAATTATLSSTHLVRVADNAFLYYFGDKDITSTSEYHGFSVDYGCEETLEFYTITSGYPADLQENLMFKWLPDTFTYETTSGMLDGEYIFVEPSGKTYNIKCFTRDVPILDLAMDSYDGNGSYDFNTGAFVSDMYTPSGDPIDYIVYHPTQASINSMSIEVPIVYDLRVDEVSFTGQPGTPVTITGGLFDDDLVIYVAGVKIDSYTVSADRKTLTFDLNNVKYGSSDVWRLGWLDIVIVYGQIGTKLLAKKIPEAINLTTNVLL